MFTWYHNSPLTDLFHTCVDDFIWAGSNTFKTNAPDPLCKKLQVGKGLSKASKYVGNNISQGSDSITLDQTDYITSIKSQLSMTNNCKILKHLMKVSQDLTVN